jgi:HAD superfamily hydrolase (TIGR01490 family)
VDRSAAFFDLDRTVMAGASTWHFGVAALRRGMYKRRSLVRDAWKALAFRRRGSTDEGAEALRAQMLGAVRGLRRGDMDALVPDVLGPILTRVHRDVYLRILEHERAGVTTYLCSASPVEIVAPVARALDMTGGALATVAAVDEAGVYTGELVGPFCYGAGKRAAIEQEAARAGLDLLASYAYSDSASDLPMLEAVGYPVAVNPDGDLQAVARARAWPELHVKSSTHTARAGLVVAGAGVVAGFVGGRTSRDQAPTRPLPRAAGPAAQRGAAGSIRRAIRRS